MKAARIAGLAAGLALVTSPAAALAAQSTPAAPQTTDVGNTMQEYSQQAAALVKVHNVTGTFAFNQEAQTANDVIQSIFRKAAASLCSILPVSQGVADDAAIAEWAGLPVAIVEGSVDNVKLTVQRDIAMADEKLRSNLLPDVRTGNGYDVHQLVPGDGVTLCGVFIPHDQKLRGHSDADVALHALTDALLATCGAGDIGDHFPPSDMQWKGAASRIFLEHAARIVRENGGTIMNADISLIAEAPKVGPHRNEMRESLSRMLGISMDRCSVKATTNEKIGFVGRREGIAAIATATVVYRGASA